MSAELLEEFETIEAIFSDEFHQQSHDTFDITLKYTYLNIIVTFTTTNYPKNKPSISLINVSSLIFHLLKS